MSDVRYPIGKYEAPQTITVAQRAEWLEQIRVLPAEMGAATAQLSDSQLDTPYREGGWTVRQVVHHVADSHTNSYIRFRWALTEENPLIKVYNQNLWAGLADAAHAPVTESLALLGALHSRWLFLLRSMTDADFAKTLRHPDLGELKLEWMLGLYAWHGRHHLAHINNAKLP